MSRFLWFTVYMWSNFLFLSYYSITFHLLKQKHYGNAVGTVCSSDSHLEEKNVYCVDHSNSLSWTHLFDVIRAIEPVLSIFLINVS